MSDVVYGIGYRLAWNLIVSRQHLPFPLAATMVHPAQFPDLPPTPEEFYWPPDVLQAHRILTRDYARASTLVRQEQADPLRLRVHAEGVVDKLVPILEALVPEVGDQGWLEACATALGQITIDLERGAAVAEGITQSEQAKLKRLVPILVERTGLRGRPRKVVEPVWLADAVASHRKLTLQTLADALGIHRNTLRNYLKMYGVYNHGSNGLNPLSLKKSTIIASTLLFGRYHLADGHTSGSFIDDDSDVEEVFPQQLAPDRGKSAKRSLSPSFKRDEPKGKKARSASYQTISSDEEDTTQDSASPRLRPTTSSFQNDDFDFDYTQNDDFDYTQALTWAPTDSTWNPMATLTNAATTSTPSTSAASGSMSAAVAMNDLGTGASTSITLGGSSRRARLQPYVPPPPREGLKVPPAANFWG
ncbi:hypothetical protein C8F04DRAFT_1184327 [Mycena alexandri]|uniref:Uncharacterized protein n=1 Tax=Mycena alexandri TaxID=1745969 RepID=A0AAD6SSN5_9AGAR|nr:hypothetical protein C8F04DRAFT_1184327 [Mycena alexandri]